MRHKPLTKFCFVILGSDYSGIGNVNSLLSKEEITYAFAAYADDVWEGDEKLFLGLTVFGDPWRLYNRTLFIKDLNGNGREVSATWFMII